MNASPALTVAFISLTIVVAVAGVMCVRTAYSGAVDHSAGRAGWIAAGAVGAYLAITGLLAWMGALRFDTAPPSIAVLIGAAAVLTVVLATSGIGKRLAGGLAFAYLVGFQSFRLPLELVMHRAADEGVMPVQMSLAGLNFDVVTGGSALVVALLLGRIESPRARLTLIRVWNTVGFLLLTNIVTIAILSTPAFHIFAGTPNVWIRFFPFVWLPVFFVPLALIGHILVWRKLRSER